MPQKRKIEIAPWATGRKRGQFGLVIGGHRLQVGKKQIKLLIYLHKELGRVVPYENLCSLLGYSSASSQHLRNLQMHVYLVRAVLAAHKLPITVTVARDFGYALCEVAR